MNDDKLVKGSRAVELVIDETSPSRIDSDNSEARENATDDVAKRARRKVDRRLLLWYSFVYLIMKIHVSNITNTAIMNLEDGHDIRTQLGHLTSQQWAWVLSIFYYPYLFFEPMATIALKRFTPNIWMCRIMITWVCLLGDCGRSMLIIRRESSLCVKRQPRTTQVSWPVDFFSVSQRLDFTQALYTTSASGILQSDCLFAW